MKAAYWVVGAVAAVVVIGLIARSMSSSQPVVQQGAAPSTEVMTSTSTSTSAAAPQAAAQTSGSASANAVAPAAKHFTVNGNDQTADLKAITVAAGTPVTITFGANAGTTYHGGLDFRSPVLNTGTITPGSTKTVSFTATKSFSFTPYWPATNIAKPYTINVVVQ